MGRNVVGEANYREEQQIAICPGHESIDDK
jgi:hypothetical protein